MITFKQFIIDQDLNNELLEASKTEVVLGHLIKRKYDGKTEFYAGSKKTAWWSSLANARTFDTEFEARVKAAELRSKEPEGSKVSISSKASEHSKA